jgi:DNA-binding transcriptional LysR family regulator
MDLPELRYFEAVASHGSFSAAALALGITQPGLTKAVRRLEASLDCKLLRRLARGVALTEQGQALLRHSRQLSVQLLDARAEVRAVGGGAVGRISIGAGPSWLTSALPGVVARMASDYPGLSFRVAGGFLNDLIERLRSADLDLVIAAIPSRIPEGLRAITLTQGTLAVAVRDGHPLTTRTGLRAIDTLDHAWVLPGRAVLSRLRLEALFRVRGLEPPEATIEADSVSFIAGVLRQSDMLSFMTSQFVGSGLDGIVPLSIPELSSERSAGIMLRASAAVSPAAEALIEAMRQFADQIGKN